MPAVDPLSASSRPMVAFDALPSQPLKFAATLQPLDLNFSPPKPPRPRPYKESLPQNFPSPQYHHRHPSNASLQDFGDLNLGVKVTGSDEWMQEEVAKCVDHAEGKLDIKNLGLTQLSTKISDLRNLVKLPSSFSPSASPRIVSSPRHLAPQPSASTFQRHVSAPATSSFFREMNRSVSKPPTGSLAPAAELVSRKAIARSKTGAIGVGRPQAMDMEIYANGNLLTSLPSALFEISNLTVLSLRSNRLTTLPAAVGELKHLKELNISNNNISYLPSTILQLDLQVFSVHPNPFLKPAEGEAMSPLVSREVSLLDICIRRLLSPHDLPPLLESYNWEWDQTSSHPLLDPKCLHSIIPQLSEDDCKRVQACLRSAAQAHASRTHTRTDLFPRSYRPDKPDDASVNPYYVPCPSPRHLEYSGGAPPTRFLFLHAAEERIQWRQVCNQTGLPVKWLGCSPGCLAFLDDPDEDEWTIDEDDL